MIENGKLKPSGALQMRGGVSTALTIANPTPASREILVEIDTGHVKVGDGIHSWTELPYVSTPRAAVSVILSDEDIAKKSIDLPADYSGGLEVYVNGLDAELGIDCEINGEKLTWEEKELDGVLRIGDRISMKYNRR